MFEEPEAPPNDLGFPLTGEQLDAWFTARIVQIDKERAAQKAHQEWWLKRHDPTRHDWMLPKNPRKRAQRAALRRWRLQSYV